MVKNLLIHSAAGGMPSLGASAGIKKGTACKHTHTRMAPTVKCHNGVHNWVQFVVLMMTALHVNCGYGFCCCALVPGRSSRTYAAPHKPSLVAGLSQATEFHAVSSHPHVDLTSTVSSRAPCCISMRAILMCPPVQHI